MSTVKPGRRHKLLLYSRMMDRVCGIALISGLFVAAWLAGIHFGYLPHLTPLAKWLSYGGAIILFAIGLFALLARNMAYVQARPDHLRVVTPFLRLKISYQRIKTIRSGEMAYLFPRGGTNWGTRSFLDPFYAKTAVITELSSLPLSRKALRLFLAPQMFIPRTNSMVFLVSNWMAFSTEIESRRGNRRSSPSTQKHSGFGLLKDISRK